LRQRRAELNQPDGRARDDDQAQQIDEIHAFPADADSSMGGDGLFVPMPDACQRKETGVKTGYSLGGRI